MHDSVLISITEGRSVRDLLHNGFLELANTAGVKVIIATPAANVPEFLNEWLGQNVEFVYLKEYIWTNKHARLYSIREKVQKLNAIALGLWINVENRMFKVDESVVQLMKSKNVRAVVLTHPMHHGEFPIYRAAVSLGIPTVGLVRSWDNLYKGLRIRSDRLAIWNRINFCEAQNLLRYPAHRLNIVGAMQFDFYFRNKPTTREEFADRFGLNAKRKLITIATIGQLKPNYDETYLVDCLLDALQNGSIQGNPQIICRLHPASRLEHFLKYQNHPDLRLSYITGYIPGIGWTMSESDVTDVMNILYHSDVVISPGSTITLEAAIFDTPTIVPDFHTYLPDSKFSHHLENHYKRLVDLKLIHRPETVYELIEAINHALTDPTWFQKERRQIVDDYIGFTDGKSIERVWELILSNIYSQQEE